MSFYELFSEKELELLRQRAERTAQFAADDQDGEGLIDVLQVQVASEQYAIPLNLLTAAYQVNINLVSPLVPVPCTPRFIAGIVNIRGHVTPVIDLAVLLGLPKATEQDADSLMVVTNEQMTIAFLVHAIGDPMSVHTSDFVPVPETLALAKADYIQGTLPDGTTLLNVAAILNDPAIIIDESR